MSTEQQVERDSLNNQQEQLRRFAELRGTEAKLYVDPGFSAKDQNRPAFQDLIRDIRAGVISTVVVTKLDRITRSLKDLVWLLDFFTEHGVEFVSISQQFDTSNPVGRFGLSLLGSVAQLERELTAERVAEDMKARSRRGKWNGGVVPHGYMTQQLCYRRYLQEKAKGSLNGHVVDHQTLKDEISHLESDPTIRAEAEQHSRTLVPLPKTLVINEDEANVIQEIFQLYLRLKSLRGVVHALNSLGLRTRNGQTWATSSIKRIIQNPTYCGSLTYNKREGVDSTSRPRPKSEHIVVEGAVPAIISKEQFVEAQQNPGVPENRNASVQRVQLPTHRTGLLWPLQRQNARLLRLLQAAGQSVPLLSLLESHGKGFLSV